MEKLRIYCQIIGYRMIINLNMNNLVQGQQSSAQKINGGN